MPENSRGNEENIRRNANEPPPTLTPAHTVQSFTSLRRNLSGLSEVDGHLMLGVLSQAVAENIKAGPHGALQPSQSFIPPERMSIASIQTVLMKITPSYEEEPIDFETAIEETGHGCFQYKLWVLCGFVYACCSLSTTTLSLVLPAAQNDFNLKSVDKGVLNTAPLWGMVVGGYFWGHFADSRGRRFVLLWALSIDCLASFVSSLCQHYEPFYVLRIFNGFGIIGATSIVFAYLGEFLGSSHRDRYLARLELMWTVGIIALPVIGLAILPHKIEFGERGVFVYDSWRMFVFTCGIPSMIAALCLSRMPESPRFLLLQGKLTKTRDVLVRMFVSNTGKSKDEFSVKVLSESAEADHYYFQTVKNIPFCKRVKNLMGGILKQHADLFSGRSCFNIIITCYVDFGLISVYYTMMLWVPELLHRQKHYLDTHPGSSPSLCTTASIQAEEDQASSEIKLETFLHTIITCLACMPTTLMLLCLIELVSKKVLLVGIMLSAAVPAACLVHVYSVFQAVTMLSLLKSLTNLAEAILFCAIVQIFPINTRGTALSLTVTVGRIGSVVGNVVFGVMIDKHCSYLFYGMGANLVLSGLACLLLPTMRRET